MVQEACYAMIVQHHQNHCNIRTTLMQSHSNWSLGALICAHKNNHISLKIMFTVNFFLTLILLLKL